jgi:hypothetical protein
MGQKFCPNKWGKNSAQAGRSENSYVLHTPKNSYLADEAKNCCPENYA